MQGSSGRCRDVGRRRRLDPQACAGDGSGELPVLSFESRAHLVDHLSGPDRVSAFLLVFASETSFDTYRATSRLVMPAVNGSLRISESATSQISRRISDSGLMRSRSSCLRPNMEASHGSRWPGRPLRLPEVGISSASPAIIPTRTCPICSMLFSAEDLAGSTASPHAWYSPATPPGSHRACTLIWSRRPAPGASSFSALSRKVSFNPLQTGRGPRFCVALRRVWIASTRKRWRWERR